MPDPTFAESQLARVQTLLAENVGVKTVNIDGNMVAYDDLLNQLQFWERKVAIQHGSRRRILPIYLGGG